MGLACSCVLLPSELGTEEVKAHLLAPHGLWDPCFLCSVTGGEQIFSLEPLQPVPSRPNPLGGVSGCVAKKLFLKVREH